MIQQTVFSEFAAIGIRVVADWSGCHLAAGDPPSACPVCGDVLVAVDRVSDGDTLIETLMCCDRCDVCWDTGITREA